MQKVLKVTVETLIYKMVCLSLESEKLVVDTSLLEAINYYSEGGKLTYEIRSNFVFF